MSKKALWAGINTFPMANHLNGCINDANAMGELLVSTYDFARSDVRVITEAEASNRGWRNELDTICTGRQKGDVLVLGASTHGTYIADTSGDEPIRDEAKCPYDLDQGLLIDDEIRERYGNLPAGVRLTDFSDLCFSGTVTRVMLGETLPGMMPSQDRAKWRVRFLNPSLEWMPQRGDQVLDNPWPIKSKRTLTQASMNHLLIAGCTDQQYCYDASFGGKYYGAMTYACLHVIKQFGPQITYSQLVREMNVCLKTWGFPQTPQLEGPSAWKRRKLFT